MSWEVKYGFQCNSVLLSWCVLLFLLCHSVAHSNLWNSSKSCYWSLCQSPDRNTFLCFQPLAACITNWQQLVLPGELQLLSPFLHLESWHQYKVSRVHMYTWQLDTIIHTAALVKKMLFMLRTPALEAWKCSPITEHCNSFRQAPFLSPLV